MHRSRLNLIIHQTNVKDLFGNSWRNLNTNWVQVILENDS